MLSDICCGLTHIPHISDFNKLQSKKFIHTHVIVFPNFIPLIIMWQARAAFDKGILLQACFSSLWECLPSALRLMLQTSQQICFCYDEWNFDVLGILFYSGSLAKNASKSGKHYFVFDLGRLNWFTRKATVLPLKMTQKHWGFHATTWQSFITEKALETTDK